MSGVTAFGQPLDIVHDTVPSTFEERGTTIPFTTPELAYCRLRRGSRGSLEVLVNGFSGGRCTYVFPWASIPQVVRLRWTPLVRQLGWRVKRASRGIIAPYRCWGSVSAQTAG